MDYIIQFSQKYPNVKLMINNLPKDINHNLFCRRELDLWIGILPFINQKDFHTKQLKELENTLFATTTYLAQHRIKGELEKGQLGQHTFITRFTHFKPENLLINELEDCDFKIKYEMASLDIVYAMVSKGLGIGYAPEYFIDSYKNNDIKTINISGVNYPKTVLGAVYNKGQKSKAMLVFLNGLEEFLDKKESVGV